MDSLFILLCSVVQAFTCPVLQQAAAYLDPSHLPVPNIYSSLRGFNAFTGAQVPSQDLRTTGWRSVLFEPTTTLEPYGRVSLHSGIDSIDEGRCVVDYKKRIITNLNEFRNESFHSLVKGSAWTVGPALRIKMGADIKLAKIEVEKDIDPLAQSTGGFSAELEKLKNFFIKEHGIIITMEVTCLRIWVRLDFQNLPNLRIGFVNSIKNLYNAPKHHREIFFRGFIENYGTHVMTEGYLGRKLLYHRYFTGNERSMLSKEEILVCTQSSFEYSVLSSGGEKTHASMCKLDNVQNSTTSVRTHVKEKIVSIGSNPHRNLEDWISDDAISPIPIRITKLTPIIALFREDLLLKIDPNMDVDLFLNWVIPMYANIPKLMGYKNASKEKTCGVNDLCGLDRQCVQNGTDDYNCKVTHSVFWEKDNRAFAYIINPVRRKPWSPAMDTVAPQCSNTYCSFTFPFGARTHGWKIYPDLYRTYGKNRIVSGSESWCGGFPMQEVELFFDKDEVLIKTLSHSKPDSSGYY